jgi:hypothetical protein
VHASSVNFSHPLLSRLPGGVSAQGRRAGVGMSDHVDGECECPLASKHCGVAMVRRDLWFRAVRNEDKEAMLRVAHTVGHGKVTRYSLEHTHSLIHSRPHALTHPCTHSSRTPSRMHH